MPEIDPKQLEEIKAKYQKQQEERAKKRAEWLEKARKEGKVGFGSAASGSSSEPTEGTETGASSTNLETNTNSSESDPTPTGPDNANASSESKESETKAELEQRVNEVKQKLLTTNKKRIDDKFTQTPQELNEQYLSLILDSITTVIDREFSVYKSTTDIEIEDLIINLRVSVASEIKIYFNNKKIANNDTKSESSSRPISESGAKSTLEDGESVVDQILQRKYITALDAIKRANTVEEVDSAYTAFEKFDYDAKYLANMTDLTERLKLTSMFEESFSKFKDHLMQIKNSKKIELRERDEKNILNEQYEQFTKLNIDQIDYYTDFVQVYNAFALLNKVNTSLNKFSPEQKSEISKDNKLESLLRIFDVEIPENQTRKIKWEGFVNQGLLDIKNSKLQEIRVQINQEQLSVRSFATGQSEIEEQSNELLSKARELSSGKFDRLLTKEILLSDFKKEVLDGISAFISNKIDDRLRDAESVVGKGGLTPKISDVSTFINMLESYSGFRGMGNMGGLSEVVSVFEHIDEAAYKEFRNGQEVLIYARVRLHNANYEADENGGEQFASEMEKIDKQHLKTIIDTVGVKQFLQIMQKDDGAFYKILTKDQITNINLKSLIDEKFKQEEYSIDGVTEDVKKQREEKRIKFIKSVWLTEQKLNLLPVDLEAQKYLIKYFYIQSLKDDLTSVNSLEQLASTLGISQNDYKLIRTVDNKLNKAFDLANKLSNITGISIKYANKARNELSEVTLETATAIAKHDKIFGKDTDTLIAEKMNIPEYRLMAFNHAYRVNMLNTIDSSNDFTFDAISKKAKLVGGGPGKLKKQMEILASIDDTKIKMPNYALALFRSAIPGMPNDLVGFVGLKDTAQMSDIEQLVNEWDGSVKDYKKQWLNRIKAMPKVADFWKKKDGFLYNTKVLNSEMTDNLKQVKEIYESFMTKEELDDNMFHIVSIILQTRANMVNGFANADYTEWKKAFDNKLFGNESKNGRQDLIRHLHKEKLISDGVASKLLSGVDSENRPAFNKDILQVNRNEELKDVGTAVLGGFIQGIVSHAFGGKKKS